MTFDDLLDRKEMLTAALEVMDKHMPNKYTKHVGTTLGSTVRSFRYGSEIVDASRIHLAKIDTTLAHLAPLDAKLAAWKECDNTIASAGGLLQASEEMFVTWLSQGKNILESLAVDETTILPDFKVLMFYFLRFAFAAWLRSTIHTPCAQLWARACMCVRVRTLT